MQRFPYGIYPQLFMQSAVSFPGSLALSLMDLMVKFHTAHRAVSNMTFLLFICSSSFIGYRVAVVTQGSKRKRVKDQLRKSFGGYLDWGMNLRI